MARIELLKDVVARWADNDDYNDDDHDCSAYCDHDCDCDVCSWCDCCSERLVNCGCDHGYGYYCESDEDE